MTLLLLFASSNSSYAKGESVTVKEPSVNARSGPGTNYEIVEHLKKDETFTVLDQKDDWIKIQLSKKKSAWVANWVVTISEPKKQLKPPYATITASSIAVYSKPSFQGEKVTDVQKDNDYKIIKEKNNWFQIKLPNEKKGWVPKWYTRSQLKETVDSSTDMQVTALFDDVPLRKSTSPYSEIIKTASKGDEFTVTAIKKNTYEVKLSWGKKAYVAGWLVQASKHTPQIKMVSEQHDFTGKTIVIDPGHGGNDGGTIGASQTLEKNLTLQTAQLLERLLVNSGANVILTRNKDEYQSLSSRVKYSNKLQPDAFISIHYDSAEQSDLRGVTPYYYHSYQKPLARSIYYSLQDKSKLTIREERFGDYHVLRQNSQPSVLLELGYLSNKEEEEIVTSYAYQEAIVTAVYNGLGNYFAGGK